MKIINFLLLSLFIHTICLNIFPKERDVIILTDSTFDKAIETYEYLLVLFYEPWCEHCKTFYREYQNSARILSKEKLYLFKVDISKEKKLAEKFQIQALPALKLFTKEKVIEYTGGSKEGEIVNWMRKKTNGIAVTILKSVKDVEKFQEENEVVLIYFGSNKTDIKEFTKSARKNEDVPFGIVESEKIINHYSKPGTIVIIKKSDKIRQELTNIDGKDIDYLINLYSLPKVMNFNEKTAQIVFGKSIPSIILFANKKLKNRWEDYNKLMKYISRIYRTRLKIIIANINDKISKKLADYIGLKDKDIPSVFIIDTKDELIKYKLKGEINDINILDFIKNWENNNLKPYLKSDELPIFNNGPVFILVGSTFEKEVINNDNDVMVLFHTPSCNHCKNLIPKYEEIAWKFKDKNPKLKFTIIDANTNEIESININHFPSIKFYPGNKKDKAPLDYTGKREINELIEFIKKNAANPIVLDEKKKEDMKKDIKVDGIVVLLKVVIHPVITKNIL